MGYLSPKAPSPIPNIEKVIIFFLHISASYTGIHHPEQSAIHKRLNTPHIHTPQRSEKPNAKSRSQSLLPPNSPLPKYGNRNCPGYDDKGNLHPNALQPCKSRIEIPKSRNDSAKIQTICKKTE
jgi:hypothetical protein